MWRKYLGNHFRIWDLKLKWLRKEHQNLHLYKQLSTRLKKAISKKLDFCLFIYLFIYLFYFYIDIFFFNSILIFLLRLRRLFLLLKLLLLLLLVLFIYLYIDLFIFIFVFIMYFFSVPRGNLNVNKVLKTFLGYPCCFRS